MKTSYDGNTVVFTFADGVKPVRFNTTAASQQVRDEALMYGFNVRLLRTAAGAKNEADRRAKVAELADYFETGATEWERKSSSSATAKSDQAAIETVADLMGISFDEAREKFYAKKAVLKGATDGQQASGAASVTTV